MLKLEVCVILPVLHLLVCGQYRWVPQSILTLEKQRQTKECKNKQKHLSNQKHLKHLRQNLPWRTWPYNTFLNNTTTEKYLWKPLTKFVAQSPFGGWPATHTWLLVTSLGQEYSSAEKFAGRMQAKAKGRAPTQNYHSILSFYIINSFSGF